MLAEWFSFLSAETAEMSQLLLFCSSPLQSGKKTVKAVLWVSADGLRVVDDKTKVCKPREK